MRSIGITLSTVGCCAILLLLAVGDTHCGTFTAGVNYGEPKKNMCSPYEVLKPSEPCCEPTCDDDCLHAICRRAPDSAPPKPTCVCRQGYVRHDGSCIRKDLCPARKPITYDSYRPQMPNYYHRTTARPAHYMPMSCGPNERLSHCRPACEPTCEKDCSGVKQPQVCIPEPCCVCKDGYVRHNGRCIKRCDCPKRNHFFGGRPLSGEYIDFEVVSLEGFKSDEDFGYKPKAEYRMNKPGRLPAYEQKKSMAAPMYVRTLGSGSSSAQASSYEHPAPTTERPALYPPLCACHATKKMHTPALRMPPAMQDRTSYESTEEDTDIVPYAPLPTVGSYRPTPPKDLFPPPSTPASARPYYMPRKTIQPPPAAPKPVHRSDLNEPLDHYCGSGQQSSAAQEEQPKKKPTIWPPVSKHCTRCGFRRH